MEIVLKLKLSGSKFATDTRDAFWREYCQQAQLPFDGEDYHISGPERQYSPERLEAVVRARFIPRLNDQLSYRFGGRGDRPSRMIELGAAKSPFDNLVLTLSRIEYNSLDLVMKVLGLENDALLPLLCGALEVYAPDAFVNAMPGNGVDLRATAEFDRSLVTQNETQIPVLDNKSNTPESASSIKELARNKLWGILNGSLILPVILALAVLYQMAGSIERDHVEVGKERALLAQERNTILQTLAQQNAALIQMLKDRSGSPPSGGSIGNPTHP